MKIRFFVICYFSFIVVMSAFFVAQNPLFCYFSGIIQTTSSINVGKISVNIKNLKIEYNYNKTNDDTVDENGNIYGGDLRLNSSDSFLFTVNNACNNAIKYHLNIEISWDDELSEAGKFFVFPYDMANDIILENIKTNNFANAVIGADVSDIKQIASSAGQKLGISETVDSAVLSGLDDEQNSSKDYKFKLFFYKDSYIADNADIFNNKNIEINIAAIAELSENTSGWTAADKRFFRLSTKTDIAPPLITEVAKPKTFFVTQANAINLADYALASDAFDGNITDQIEISTYPQFNPQKAGTYTITYNVKDNADNSAVPLEIKVIIWDFVKIKSGGYSTLALTSHGRVYSWGNNYYGQLGHGNSSSSYVPKLIESLYDVVDICAGNDSSYALCADGQIYSWGLNDQGQLGDGTTDSKNKPEKVKQPEGVRFVTMASKYATVAAVTDEGYVYTWGYGDYGSLGNGEKSNRSVPEKINLSNIQQVSVSRYSGAAITKDGQLYTWGDNQYGRLGLGDVGLIFPPTLVTYFSDKNIKIKEISVGAYNIAAVSEGGQLFNWGYGGYGNIGDGSTATKNLPELIISADVLNVATGDNYTGFITTEGKVYFFGQNYYGQHGSGNADTHLTPIQLNGVDAATYICVGANSSFILCDNKTVYGMGYGGGGTLGTGNTSNSNVPVEWAFIPPNPY